MTTTELRELIVNGENSHVEFKRDEIENHKLTKELVAFANLGGGCVLLGVDRDGSVHGLARQDPRANTEDDEQGGRTYQHLEEWVMQACRDKIRPEIIPYFEIFRDVEPGRDVAAVQVARGWSVHHVWHNQRRTYCIRVGSLSREASPEELARLFQQRGAFRSELRPVSGTSIADLDRRRLEDYFTQIRQQDTPASTPSDQWRRETAAWARDQDQEHWRSLVDYKEQEWRAEREADWVSLLVNTEVLDDGDRQPATVAGLLLFGSNPSRYLPQAKIDAAAYLGTEKDYDAGERCTLRGPIVRLQDAGGAILEPGLVERAVAFVRRNIDTVRLEDGVRRQARWDYPEDAVREAVVNAIVHRDYLLSGTDIELSIYLDRLEVVSPGRLPNGITPARMRSGCRSARNELLKDVMRDYGYPEHMGMGIPRKIMRSMRDHNGTDPELVETDEGFLLRLWKNPRA